MRTLLRRAAGTVSVLLLAGCLPSTWARLSGGDTSTVAALFAVLVPLTLPVLVLSVALGGYAFRPWRRAAAVGGTPRGHVVRTAAATLPVAVLLLHTAWVAPSLVPGHPVASVAAGQRPGASGPGDVAGSGGSLTVLALNLEFGQADAAQVVDLVRRERVDVLAAVELTPDAVERLRAAGLETVLPSSVLLPEGGASGSGLWARRPLTPLDPVPGMAFEAPRARIALGDGRTAVVSAVHPHPPTTPSIAVSDLQALASATAVLSRAGEAQVTAGDFNASRDVEPFRWILDAGLVDAADEVGVTGGAWPGLTWPADRGFPPVMRIDHVLFSPGRFAASDVRTVEVSGTDHRGVLARLAVR